MIPPDFILTDIFFNCGESIYNADYIDGRQLWISLMQLFPIPETVIQIGNIHCKCKGWDVDIVTAAVFSYNEMKTAASGADFKFGTIKW